MAVANRKDSICMISQFTSYQHLQQALNHVHAARRTNGGVLRIPGGSTSSTTPAIADPSLRELRLVAFAYLEAAETALNEACKAVDALHHERERLPRKHRKRAAAVGSESSIGDGERPWLVVLRGGRCEMESGPVGPA